DTAVVVTTAPWVNFGYLVASILFIMGIKGMTHPRTAVRGNLLGALGMLIAVLVTVISTDTNWLLAIAGIIVGTAIGAWFSQAVQMTQMPQLVALFNGFGGLASVLVAAVEIPTSELENAAFAGLAAGLTGVI